MTTVAMFAQAAQTTTYTVTQKAGVTYITGSLPLREMSAIFKSHSKWAIVDVHLASLSGTTLAFGLPDACDAARVETIQNKLRALGRAPGETKGLWMQIGEHGSSSLFMFHTLKGDRTVGYAHPHDAADFRRCLLMLEMEPDLPNGIGSLRKSSLMWAVLIENWQRLSDLLASEVPTWRSGVGSAPKTNALIRELKVE
jgi:hypothetical protein